MKKLAYLFAAFILINFISCSKSGTSPSKPKGGTSTTTAMYPSSVTIVNNGVSATFQLTYDSNNNLVKYAQPGVYEIDYTPHIVTQSSFSTETDVVNTYSYSGPSNTPVDIYTNTPSQLSITSVNKNNLSGTSITTKGKLWAFLGNQNITQMATSDQGGQTINFAYDNIGNFKTISFTNLSGTQAGKVFSQIIVNGLDNHPSPYSSVKGYYVISYPQYFVPDYALAFCKNNPTQIIFKEFDYDKGDLETYEQDDFTYTYNAQGYPLTVSVKTTYPGPPQQVFYKNYTYTYK